VAHSFDTHGVHVSFSSSVLQASRRLTVGFAKVGIELVLEKPVVAVALTEASEAESSGMASSKAARQGELVVGTLAGVLVSYESLKQEDKHARENGYGSFQEAF
jgi:hypothetical protein